MLRSDAENFLKLWDSGPKVFKYRRALVPIEYVVFRKVNEGDYTYYYEFEPTKSTYPDLKNLEEDVFLKMLANEELVFAKDWGWNTNTRDMKTGGCTCGAWAVRESERLHDRKCPLHHRMFEP